jgi:L-asparaginase II
LAYNAALHMPSAPSSNGCYPENPVLTRVWRGAWVESQHRGAWVMVDTAGRVLDGAGAFEAPVFARSSVKSLQALPLCESGAADRFGWSDEELALALASHNAESCHVDAVRGLLARLGLSVSDLQCGPQFPGDPAARAALAAAGDAPSALHNNCSGKHAGFLGLAKHLGDPIERYLDVESAGQRLVHDALADMSGVPREELGVSIDGCSAPSFRLPLRALATAIARVTNPGDLPPVRRLACERMARAVAAHPVLLAGRHKRLCTDLVRASSGKLFPKIGGEAVYVLGVRGAECGLAFKIDDGSTRGLHALVLDVIERLGFLDEAALRELEPWRGRPLCNWAGLDVGRIEVLA